MTGAHDEGCNCGSHDLETFTEVNVPTRLDIEVMMIQQGAPPELFTAAARKQASQQAATVAVQATRSNVSSRLASTATLRQQRALSDAFFKANGTWQARTMSIDAGIDPWTKKFVPKSGRAALRSRAARDLEARMHSAIDTQWSAGYRRGFRSRLGAPPPQALPASFVSKIDSQKRFATNFANDIVNGVPMKKGRMSFANRTALYSRGVQGSYQYGSVAAGPSKEKIFWRLGALDHCPDCPALAISGPYTASTLPTVPAGGETQCGNRCGCWLEYTGGTTPKKEAPRPPKTEQELRPPTPPGTRAPTDPELMALRDLEARMNYARRMVEKTIGTPEQAKWVQARRKANKALIELQGTMNVSKPPTFNVGQVIDGADVTQLDVREFTRVRGIDGRTVRRANPARVEKAIKNLKDEIAATPMPPTQTPGTVPTAADLEEFAVLNGAPPELYPDAVARITSRAAGSTAPPASTGGDASLLPDANESLLEATESLEATSEATVNLLGWGAKATAAIMLGAMQELAAAEHRVEVGIVDDLFELVYALGVWVVGADADVRRFIDALTKRLSRGNRPALAIWSAGVN